MPFMDPNFYPQMKICPKISRVRREYFHSPKSVIYRKGVQEHQSSNKIHFINCQPYFLSKSAKINFQSIQACTGRGKEELKKDISTAKKSYESMGFKITQYHGNNKFDQIIPHLLPSTLHICAAD